MNYSNGSEWECSMGSSQLVHVIALPIGGLIAMEARPVPRSHSPLNESDRISWETIDVRTSAGTALENRPD
jgi:hypothetical protein